MALLNELEALQRDRQHHAEAIKTIDETLERVRIALGMMRPIAKPLAPTHVQRGVYRSVHGKAARFVLDALAEKEPQSYRMLSVGRSYEAMVQLCNSLIRQGVIVSVRQKGVLGRPIWVARSKEALANVSDGGADEELGQAEPDTMSIPNMDADGSTSATVTTRALDTSAPTFPSSMTSIAASGQSS